MSYDLIKANLNLFAVLKNLEVLVEFDEEINSLAKNWDVSIQFSVKGGPKVSVIFKDGKCSVVRGKCKKPSVKLFFLSPSHLNNMMDGKGSPIPLKGFTKLGFLTKDFPKVTDKLEYYLKPTDELLKDKDYLEMNTRLTLNTAPYAIREIGLMDPLSVKILSHMKEGIVQLKILPKGPSVFIEFKGKDIIPGTGNVEKPMVMLTFKNMKIAGDFLNGKSDVFTEVANGNVTIKGQTGMLDTLNLVLDRIPEFLG